MTIAFTTARFEGVGGVTCRGCQMHIWFPQHCAAVLVATSDFTVLTDAQTRAVLHDCRRPRVFFCPNCPELDEATLYHRGSGRYGPGLAPVCPACFEPLRQRNKAPDPAET